MFSRSVFTACCALVLVFGAAKSASAQLSLYETKYDVYRTVIENEWKVEVEWNNGDSMTYGPMSQSAAFGLYADFVVSPNIASVELIPCFTSTTEYLGRYDSQAEANAAKAEAEAMSDTGVVWILEVQVPRTFLFQTAIWHYNFFSRFVQSK